MSMDPMVCWDCPLSLLWALALVGASFGVLVAAVLLRRARRTALFACCLVLAALMYLGTARLLTHWGVSVSSDGAWTPGAALTILILWSFGTSIFLGCRVPAVMTRRRRLLFTAILALSAVGIALIAVLQVRLLGTAEGIFQRTESDDPVIPAADHMLFLVRSLDLGIREVPIEHEGLVRCPEEFQRDFLSGVGMLPPYLRPESDRISDDFRACFAAFRDLAARINSGEQLVDDDFKEAESCSSLLQNRLEGLRGRHLASEYMAWAELRGVHWRLRLLLALTAALVSILVLAAMPVLRSRSARE